ncbi:MAG TPA: hypothetical protein DDW50_20950 [Firmicutes bacterium]|jgi:hypothetical protein|nr:hypothetical protein [Bacillota bacterium]
MTVQNTNRKDVYTTNGTTIYWPYTFEIFTTDGSDIKLYETNISTGDTVEITENLTKEIDNNRIKYPTSGEPRPTGYKITVARLTGRTQGTTLSTQSFDPKNMEKGLDKLTAIAQELDETNSRSVTASISEQGQGYSFPSPIPGKILGWNNNGDGLINLDNTSAGMEATLIQQSQNATQAANNATETINNLIATAFEDDKITVKKATSVSNKPGSRRQTVISGMVDNSSGGAIFISWSGLSAMLIGLPTAPVICNLAAGYDLTCGEINYIIGFTGSTTLWTNLPANKSFLQLYIDLDVATNTITGGYTELETIYSLTAPIPPAIDQHWFDLSQFKMKRYNGTAWEDKVRLMVGECVTGTSGINSIITYAINGRITSYVMTASGTITSTHAIGTPLIQVRCYGMTASNGTRNEFSSGRIGNITRTQLMIYGSASALSTGGTASYVQYIADRGW